MSFFCYQCQEASNSVGCEIQSECGKTENVAKLQDLLIYSLKGIGQIITKNNLDVKNLGQLNHETIKSLFMTATNSNFDESIICFQIDKIIDLRSNLINSCDCNDLHDSAKFYASTLEEKLKKSENIGVLSTLDEDVRSFRELNIYGLKGIAAIAYHAYRLGREDSNIYAHIYDVLSSTLYNSLSSEVLIKLLMKTAQFGVSVMALLDKAHISLYGNPEVSYVNIGVNKNPAILVTGHDLMDLDQILFQSEDSGVDIYTHGEMLPANYYPHFQKYKNLVGNYGNAWWNQHKDFKTFHGPVLCTSNCITPPNDSEILGRMFTTGICGINGCKHINESNDNKKDFSSIIELAKNSSPPDEIENGRLIGGFAHNQAYPFSSKIISSIKSGDIKQFYVIAGCDGKMQNRDYYQSIVLNLPKDTIIITAGCVKYRFNKLNLGEINGIPRLLDAGQCNDVYSIALMAFKLKDAFAIDDVNKLPIYFNISWYEQRSITVLLALIYLGFKDIKIGPTLPGFISKGTLEFLNKNFGLSLITTVDEDLGNLIKG